MRVIVSWDTEEQEAIRITYERNWKWEDFDAAIVQMMALLDSAQGKVDVIIDIRNAGYPPPGAAARFKRVAEIDHPNAGHIIFVAPNMLVQFVKGILSLLSKIHWAGLDRTQFVFVGSLEQARMMIAQAHKQSATKVKA